MRSVHLLLPRLQELSTRLRDCGAQELPVCSQSALSIRADSEGARGYGL